MVDLGSKIKVLRKSKNLTQMELANNLGLTKSMISAYESGTRCPSYCVLIKIAGFFGVTTDFLLGLEMKDSINITGLNENNTEIVLNLINALREKQ